MAKKPKVFVAMSGGVDSSVAAYLLKKRGYDVVGVFMRCYNIDGCAERDAEDARRVAEKIGIPFYVWDFEEEYKKRVVEYMVDGYKAGVTPNPDVMCNREIKFGLFFDRALASGADYVATGHYVKIQNSKFKSQNYNSKFKIINKLYQAKDSNKDQSYFLWTLTQKQLSRCLFPVGDYLKSEVRKIAIRAGLPTAAKKDSQGICFLGKVSVADFLSNYIPEKRGNVLSVSGAKIGEHRGAQFYTVGQRHINIIQNSKFKSQNYNSKFKDTEQKEKTPVYVVDKNVKTNTLIVAEEGDDSLFKKEIKLANVNFINPDDSRLAARDLPVLARVRYRQPLEPAALTLTDLTRTNKKNVISINQQNRRKSAYRIIFNNPIKFVAPGQSAVFYSRKGEMLGGGIIL